MSGFYKQENDEWFYAPNFVYNANYTLLIEDKDNYIYPIDGWTWYNEPPEEYVFWLESLNMN